MLIQPILEFKGVRIELNVEEAMKIAEGKADGANRVQAEVAMIVGVHSKHLPAPEGIEAVPLLRAPGDIGKAATPYGRSYPIGIHPDAPVKCDVCGKTFKTQRGLNTHSGLVHKDGEPAVQGPTGLQTDGTGSGRAYDTGR